MPRPPRFALRVREDRPGFVERTSVCVQRTRAHRARDSASISDLPSPRQTGTQDQEQRRARPRRGARDGSRAFRCQHTDVLSTEPGRWRGPFGQDA